MLVDFREKRSKIPMLLEKLQVPFKTANLQTDYIISKDCFIERKTVTDFISSVTDKRIFRQIDYLAHICNPLLIIEGLQLYNTGRIASNNIRGIILWATIKKKISVMQTRDEYDTARVLHLLFKKYYKNETDKNISFKVSNTALKRKNISPWNQQINMLQQIPNIGPKTAKELLMKFGSIQNILCADDRDLIKIENIGKDRLVLIRKIFPSLINSKTS